MKKSDDGLNWDGREVFQYAGPLLKLLAKLEDETIVDIVRALAEHASGSGDVKLKLPEELTELLNRAGEDGNAAPWEFFRRQKPAAKAKPVAKATKATSAKPKKATSARARPLKPEKVGAMKDRFVQATQPAAHSGGLPRNEVIDVLKTAPLGLSLAELGKSANLPPKTLKSTLKSLKRDFLACCSGTTRNAVWHAGSSPPEAPAKPNGAPRRKATQPSLFSSEPEA